MKRFLLLHGSWHGAWCWYKVAPRLRREGEVVVPNLPGRGRDPAFKPMVTLNRMVEHVGRFLDAQVPTLLLTTHETSALWWRPSLKTWRDNAKLRERMVNAARGA